MIKNINQNAPKFYPDVKTYIEEKSQIDVKHLAKVVSDKVELSNNAKNSAKNNTQEPVYTPPVTKSDSENPDTEKTAPENLDTYF